ncbi:hypothetical protein [Streptomyces orinoci]|uniref:MgtC-like C-terminal domain-containing protein n=1 Tax=Streptomyces orinoci TaxID=67339 RepID=A0ABV3K8I3_STRON|nr:hypothetical protein [Streptomyces orinoci]
MKLLTRHLFRRPRAAVRGTLTHCTLQAVCDPGVEGKVRALCVVAFGGTGIRLNSFRSFEPDDSVNVVIEVTLTSDGPAAAALDRLVVQLAREPRVRDLRWDLHTGPLTVVGP